MSEMDELETERIERERERHELEKERVVLERERHELDKRYRKRDQSQAWFFRYLSIFLQTATLGVVFVYPMISEQDALESRIKETVAASIKNEFVKNVPSVDQSLRLRQENQIKKTITASINDEFNKRFASTDPHSFTVDQFKVIGPAGSTLDGLVSALFKTAADGGQKSLDNTLKTAIDAVDLADKGFSLLVKITDKAGHVHLWSSTKEPDTKIPRVIPDQVTFENDSFDLNEAAKTSLDKVADYLKGERGKSDKILVEGHASAVGPAQHNVVLSKERALQVTKYLAEHGVAEERITPHGFGQGYQWLPFESDSAKNRRVRIAICGEETGSDRCAPKKGSALVAQHQQLRASE